MKRLLWFLVLGIAWVSSYSAAAEHTPCWVKGLKYPAQPFALSVELDGSTFRVGDRVRVTYRLTNTTDRPAAACASGWADHFFRGADGKGLGITTVHKDGISGDSIFRLPGGAVMSWYVTVKVPDVRPGSGSFVGHFSGSSFCPDLWQGQVESDDVAITLLPAE
jgi:hypothetical protein